MSMTENKKQISWSAPEFIHYPKNAWWFVGLTVIGLGLAVYFAFRKEFLNAFLFLLFYMIAYYYSKIKAKILEIKIDEKGVTFGGNHISYAQIKSFWIVYEPDVVKTLNFETTAYLNRFITLQLGNTDPEQVREVLSEHIVEDTDRGEQISDKLARTLKF